MRANSLQLGSKDKCLPVPEIVEWLHSKGISGYKQASGDFVPKGEGEHSLDPVEHTQAEHPICVKENLRVSVRLELTAEPHQLHAKLSVVVDFAVEDDRQLTVERRHRL